MHLKEKEADENSDHKHQPHLSKGHEQKKEEEEELSSYKCNYTTTKERRRRNKLDYLHCNNFLPVSLRSSLSRLSPQPFLHIFMYLFIQLTVVFCQRSSNESNNLGLVRVKTFLLLSPYSHNVPNLSSNMKEYEAWKASNKNRPEGSYNKPPDLNRVTNKDKRSGSGINGINQATVSEISSIEKTLREIHGEIDTDEQGPKASRSTTLESELSSAYPLELDDFFHGQEFENLTTYELIFGKDLDVGSWGLDNPPSPMFSLSPDGPSMRNDVLVPVPEDIDISSPSTATSSPNALPPHLSPQLTERDVGYGNLLLDEAIRVSSHLSPPELEQEMDMSRGNNYENIYRFGPSPVIGLMVKPNDVIPHAIHRRPTGDDDDGKKTVTDLPAADQEGESGTPSSAVVSTPPSSKPDAVQSSDSPHTPKTTGESPASKTDIIIIDLEPEDLPMSSPLNTVKLKSGSLLLNTFFSSSSQSTPISLVRESMIPETINQETYENLLIMYNEAMDADNNVHLPSFHEVSKRGLPRSSFKERRSSAEGVTTYTIDGGDKDDFAISPTLDFDGILDVPFRMESPPLTPPVKRRKNSETTTKEVDPAETPASGDSLKSNLILSTLLQRQKQDENKSPFSSSFHTDSSNPTFRSLALQQKKLESLSSQTSTHVSNTQQQQVPISIQASSIHSHQTPASPSAAIMTYAQQQKTTLVTSTVTSPSPRINALVANSQRSHHASFFFPSTTVDPEAKQISSSPPPVNQTDVPVFKIPQVIKGPRARGRPKAVKNAADGKAKSRSKRQISSAASQAHIQQLQQQWPQAPMMESPLQLSNSSPFRSRMPNPGFFQNDSPLDGGGSNIRPGVGMIPTMQRNNLMSSPMQQQERYPQQGFKFPWAQQQGLHNNMGYQQQMSNNNNPYGYQQAQHSVISPQGLNSFRDGFHSPQQFMQTSSMNYPQHVSSRPVPPPSPFIVQFPDNINTNQNGQSNRCQQMPTPPVLQANNPLERRLAVSPQQQQPDGPNMKFSHPIPQRVNPLISRPLPSPSPQLFSRPGIPTPSPYPPMAPSPVLSRPTHLSSPQLPSFVSTPYPSPSPSPFQQTPQTSPPSSPSPFQAPPSPMMGPSIQIPIARTPLPYPFQQPPPTSMDSNSMINNFNRPYSTNYMQNPPQDPYNRAMTPLPPPSPYPYNEQQQKLSYSSAADKRAIDTVSSSPIPGNSVIIGQNNNRMTSQIVNEQQSNGGDLAFQFQKWKESQRRIAQIKLLEQQQRQPQLDLLHQQTLQNLINQRNRMQQNSLQANTDNHGNKQGPYIIGHQQPLQTTAAPGISNIQNSASSSSPPIGGFYSRQVQVPQQVSHPNKLASSLIPTSTVQNPNVYQRQQAQITPSYELPDNNKSHPPPSYDSAIAKINARAIGENHPVPQPANKLKKSHEQILKQQSWNHPENVNTMGMGNNGNGMLSPMSGRQTPAPATASIGHNNVNPISHLPMTSGAVSGGQASLFNSPQTPNNVVGGSTGSSPVRLNANHDPKMGDKINEHASRNGTLQTLKESGYHHHHNPNAKSGDVGRYTPSPVVINKGQNIPVQFQHPHPLLHNQNDHIRQKERAGGINHAVNHLGPPKGSGAITPITNNIIPQPKIHQNVQQNEKPQQLHSPSHHHHQQSMHSGIVASPENGNTPNHYQPRKHLPHHRGDHPYYSQGEVDAHHQRVLGNNQTAKDSEFENDSTMTWYLTQAKQALHNNHESLLHTPPYPARPNEHMITHNKPAKASVPTPQSVTIHHYPAANDKNHHIHPASPIANSKQVSPTNNSPTANIPKPHTDTGRGPWPTP